MDIDEMESSVDWKKVSTPELRRMWRSHFDQNDRIRDEYDRQMEQWDKEVDQIVAAGNWLPLPPIPEYPKMPPFPEELIGLICGAKTRAGTPCKRSDIYRSGRCKLHGGLSTGPRTEEGKARSSVNGHNPKRSP